MPTSTSTAKAAANSSPAKEKVSPTSAEAAVAELTTSAPLLINMGKVNNKKAKRIKKGRGPVLKHVDEAVQFAAGYLKEDGKEKVMVPVVMLYERKGKKKQRWW